MTRLIFGCGYLGRRVAELWQPSAAPLYAVTRTAQKAAALERAGLRPIVADVTRPESLGKLPAATTVLYAIGYDRQSGASREALHVEGLRQVLTALSPETQRVIYISTTGVYGSSDGQWVDETTPCRPTREAGRVQLAAEAVLRNHPLAERTMILRMAGIYGPGRIPRLADLVAGRPLEVAAASYLNLIHVDDAAAVVVAAETGVRPPQLFTVSDGHPCRRRDFYRHLARLLGQPEPEFVAPPSVAATTSRGHATKRVSNRRLLAELGVALRYPSYEEGLAASLPPPTGRQA